MEIKVLGTGCAGCKALYATVEQVVKELALEAVITKEEDYGIQCNGTSCPRC